MREVGAAAKKLRNQLDGPHQPIGTCQVGSIDRKHAMAYPFLLPAARGPPPNDHQLGSPFHEESQGTPSTPAFRGHLDPMRSARSGEQAAGAPFATLAYRARRGAKSAADGEGLVRSAASLAAKRSHKVRCLCAVLLAAGRDVSRGHGAGEKGQDFGRGGGVAEPY